MAIIRIFIRSIVLKKSTYNASGRALTFMPKGQVILREKPNKAIQVNCSQGFPFPPLFFHVAGRFWIDTNILEIETCTVQGNFYRGHETAETRIPHEWPSFIEYRSPRNQEVGFFKRTCCTYTFEIFIIDPVKRNIRPAYRNIYTDKLYKPLLKIL